MSQWWSTAPIRVRLTVWYTAVLALLLIVYATATFLAVRHEFGEQLEEQSRNDPEHAGFTREDWVEHQLAEVRIVLISGLPIVIGLAGLGGYLLARRALAPIDQLATDAQRITADRLHQRLSVPNQHDELGVSPPSSMMPSRASKRRSSSLRRFTADASHELRTPLSVVRGIGEFGLRETRTPSEYQDAIGSMLEEIDRLTRLVDTLLRLSRGDAGTVKLTPEVVELDALARDVASSLQVLAEERGQRLDVEADGSAP
jgi:signal transduction histidine kinase